jgi:hypothetical protein
MFINEPREPSQMFDKSSECKMTALVEAQTLVRRLAEPCAAGDSVKAQIGRAARRVGLGFNRVRTLWYADERASVSAAEMDSLRRAAGAREQKAEAHRDELAIRVEALEQQLRALASRIPQDADFYGAQADLLRSAVRGMGRADTAER